MFCLAHSPAPARDVLQWQGLIGRAAAKYDLPQSWIAHVMKVESGGQAMLRGRPITSVVGAMGLMQVMPATYSDLRRRYGLGSDPYDPSNNIEAGAAYLHELYGRYGYPALFVAYNAGPKRYEDHLFNRRPIPPETLAYVDKLAPGMAAAFRDGSVVPIPKTSRRNELFFYHAPVQAGGQENAAPSDDVTSVADGNCIFFVKMDPGG